MPLRFFVPSPKIVFSCEINDDSDCRFFCASLPLICFILLKSRPYSASIKLLKASVSMSDKLFRLSIVSSVILPNARKMLMTCYAFTDEDFGMFLKFRLERIALKCSNDFGLMSDKLLRLSSVCSSMLPNAFNISVNNLA